MINWIEINLPWYASTPDVPKAVYRKFKITDREMRAAHGMTQEEAYEAMNKAFEAAALARGDGTRYSIKGVDETLSDIQDAVLEEFEAKGLGDEEHKPQRKLESYKRFKRRKGCKEAAEAWYKWATILLWVENHPKTQAEWEAVSKWRKEHKPDSFEGRGLNKPGTRIKLTTGEVYWIGDINTNRGVCDDCTEFESNVIVAAYLPPPPEDED